MGRGKTITVHLNGEDLSLKKMLRALKKHKSPSNPYFNRSESEIMKMIVEPKLKEEFDRFCAPSDN